MARPSLFGRAASETIRVRVTPEQRRDLESIARENGARVATVIRDAVNVYVADYREGPAPFRGPKSDTMN